MHRFKHPLIAFYHGFHRPSALHYVALYDAYKTVIGIGIYEHLEVHLFPEFGMVEGQNTFHYHNLARPHGDGLFQSGGGYVVVLRLLHGLALLEHLQVLGQQRPLEGVGVVKVDFLPLFHRYLRRVVVVRIKRNNGYFSFGKTFYEFAYHCCFTRAGTARNAYDKHNEKQLRRCYACKVTTNEPIVQKSGIVCTNFAVNR